MTQTEFFDRLMPLIGTLPPEEQERVTDYYRELILDGLESGRSEEEIIAGFGAVEDIARRTLEDYSPGYTQAAPKEKKDRRWIWWLAGSPVWITLLALIFTLYVCGWAVLLSLWCSAICLLPAGLLVTAAAFFTFGGFPIGSLFQCGCGVFMLGLGAMLGIACWKLTILYARGTAAVWRGILHLFTGKPDKKEATT